MLHARLTRHNRHTRHKPITTGICGLFNPSQMPSQRNHQAEKRPLGPERGKMLTYIDQKLERWGEWSMRRDSNSLGYGNSSLSAMMGSACHASAAPLGTDEEMLSIDRAVCALPDYLKETVIQIYQHVGTMAVHARRLGISERTLFWRRDKAHAMIDQTLTITAFLRGYK